MDTKSEKTRIGYEWKLYNDGSASSNGSGGGLMLIDPDGKEYTYALQFEFEITNNEAEYEALLAGLRITQEMEIILQVKTKEEESWMTPIHEYLVSGLLLEDPKEARKIKVKALPYKLIRGSLYQRSFYTQWLRCVAPPQTDDIVKEIHKGSCGFNTEPCSMMVRIRKQGYYWPSMHKDTTKVIQECEKCKEQSAIRKAAENDAIAAGNGYPFSYWGVNMLGFKFLAIATEHSTK
ncbi:reverse transcriptase domain-containing protein [Tanacetum coccineum]